jgi:CRP-like cAMP-binding protein
MVSLNIAGLTFSLTFGRDGAQPPKADTEPGADRRLRAVPERLPRSRSRAPEAHSTQPDQLIAGSFWFALQPAEQRDFLAVSKRRTFAAGATIMEEGEAADHVLVVLSGRTQIYADDNGRRVLLAERGRGDLIGERAALEVTERSATVVALTAVEALAVTTELFANFVSTHGRVLELLESQVYARLRESPEKTLSRPQPFELKGENCTVVRTDVGGFGAQHRDQEDRQIIRRVLYEMRQGLLDGFAGQCWDEDRGDGFLVIIPPAIPTWQVMQHLVQELPPRLRRHNHTYSAAVQIQLRAAITVGPVFSDITGLSGDAIIDAARLVDAPVLKGNMLVRSPNLGLIASAFVYDTAIKPSIGEAGPQGFERVQVTVKEFCAPAWMKLIDPVASRSALITYGGVASGGCQP